MLTVIKRVSLLLVVVTFTLSLLSDQIFAGTDKVMIDPGHGGSDSGAIGNGLYEKDLTLEISKKVKSYIDRYYNISTKMTRTNDTYVSLKQRTDIANQWQADLFLSIHVNAGGGSGYEDYIHNSLTPFRSAPKQDEITSAEAQKTIRNEINAVLKKYKVRDRGAKAANFHVLRESKMPAVLLEIMFIDTKKDADLLKNNSFINDISRAIAEGVGKTFDQAQDAQTPPKDIPIYSNNNDYIVTANNLNVRAGNGTQYKKIGTIPNNTTIKAIGITNNNWIKFKYNNQDAYVSASLLKKKNNIDVTEINEDYIVTATNLNVRSGNSTNYEKIGTIANGNTIKAIGKTSNNWYKFNYNNQEAYVSGIHLKPKLDKESYTVTATMLNVRSSNSLSASLIGRLPHGSQVEIIEKHKYNWVEIDYQGQKGFVSDRFLKAN
ncbi:MAG TPA: N-acetylmuramoyl-L-alanine amidase [Pseudogracilibacillus sp.]|nr:N-acetylmuramoyl-L-alanine amidase [Pseudogracilibacillus sp.]